MGEVEARFPTVSRGLADLAIAHRDGCQARLLPGLVRARQMLKCYTLAQGGLAGFARAGP